MHDVDSMQCTTCINKYIISLKNVGSAFLPWLDIIYYKYNTNNFKHCALQIIAPLVQLPLRAKTNSAPTISQVYWNSSSYKTIISLFFNPRSVRLRNFGRSFLIGHTITQVKFFFTMSFVLATLTSIFQLLQWLYKIYRMSWRPFFAHIKRNNEMFF